MPASRSARAITLAPRSWPSSPGFAMTTRIFFISEAPVASCQSQFQSPVNGLSALDQFPSLCHRELETGNWQLDERHFLVLPPHVAERIAHLADGGIGARAVEQRIHRVAGAARGLAQRVERAAHGVVVASSV